jgi:hypothetical protein
MEHEHMGRVVALPQVGGLQQKVEVRDDCPYRKLDLSKRVM